MPERFAKAGNELFRRSQDPRQLVAALPRFHVSACPERVWMLLQPYTIGICTIPFAKQAEGNLGRAKVRLRLFDDAAEGFKCLLVSIYHRPDARVEGHTAKVLEPSHAHALEGAVERAREAFTRLVDGKRRPGIRSRDRA